jgi:hypothetical protein
MSQRIIALKNPKYHCYINASLQLIYDMTMRDIYKIQLFILNEDETKFLKSLYNFKFNDVSVKQYLVDKYYKGTQEDAAEFLMKKILSLNNPLFLCNIFVIREAYTIYPMGFEGKNSISEILTDENIQVFDTTLDIVLQLKRFTTRSLKVKNEVIPDHIVTLKEKDKDVVSKFRLKGCIVHLGETIDEGHYVYITFSDDGKPDLLVNDEIIEKYNSAKHGVKYNYLQNGYVYLYKKIGYFDRNKYKDILSKSRELTYYSAIERLLKNSEKYLAEEKYLNDESISLYSAFLKERYTDNFYWNSQNVKEAILANVQENPEMKDDLILPLKNYETYIKKLTNNTKFCEDISKHVCIFKNNYIFFPVNLFDNHWILVVYDTKHKLLTGCDSYISEFTKKATEEVLSKLAKYLKFEFFYRHRKRDDTSQKRELYSLELFTVDECEFIYLDEQQLIQQKDTFNCGVFVCWYMYCLCNSLPLTTPILPNFKDEILTKIFTTELSEFTGKKSLESFWSYELKNPMKTSDPVEITGVKPAKSKVEDSDSDFEIINPPPLKKKKKDGSKKKRGDGSKKKKIDGSKNKGRDGAKGSKKKKGGDVLKGSKKKGRDGAKGSKKKGRDGSKGSKKKKRDGSKKKK